MTNRGIMDGKKRKETTNAMLFMVGLGVARFASTTLILKSTYLGIKVVSYCAGT